MTAPDAALLADLARRLERLRPCHRDPERFFIERSEIADALRRLARAAERGDRGKAMAVDRAAELRAAADDLAESRPLVAGWLRAAAHGLRAPDLRRVRRIMLTRGWRQHWPGTARTTAAGLMAQEWVDWRRRGKPDGMPGSTDAFFARLERAGIRPIAERQIAEDLDARWRPADCIFLHAARPDDSPGA